MAEHGRKWADCERQRQIAEDRKQKVDGRRFKTVGNHQMKVDSRKQKAEDSI